MLRSGGRIVLLELHPLAWSLGARGLTGDLYFLDKALDEDGVRDSAGAGLAPSGYDAGVTDFAISERSFGSQWTVAQLVQSVVDAGMRIRQVREYPYANGCELFDGMQALPGRRFTVPDGTPTMPLMFGRVARAAP
ncbi:MAG: hypothetical protein VYA51_07315 [Planctomycetota bacterium]|nr:hypothetical protein [Planctomycetota bacterium]